MAAHIARSFLPQQAGLRASFFKEEAPVLTGKAPPSCSSLPLDLPRPGSSAGRQVRPCPTKIPLSLSSLLQLFPTVLPRPNWSPDALSPVREGIFPPRCIAKAVF